MDETPKGHLAKYLIGDLSVARRHVIRLQMGLMPAAILDRVYGEMAQSIERCIARIERDVGPLDRQSLHDQAD